MILKPQRSLATKTAFKQFKRPTTDLLTHLLTIHNWQGRRDLNPQPLVLETSALPIELHP